MNAAIYVRSARGDRTALARQERDCRALAANRGVEVVGVWSDVGPGDAPTHPSLEALVTEAEAGGVDAVVALSLDRFGRRYELVTAVERRLRAAGAAVAFVETGIGRETAALARRLAAGRETR